MKENPETNLEVHCVMQLSLSYIVFHLSRRIYTILITLFFILYSILSTHDYAWLQYGHNLRFIIRITPRYISMVAHGVTCINYYPDVYVTVLVVRSKII